MPTPIDSINTQIANLKKQKTIMLTNIAKLDTQIAALETQKVNTIKMNQSKGIATENKEELEEDGEVAVPVSTGSDGATNVNTMGDYKYAAKLGELPQRDYLKHKKVKSFSKAMKYLNKRSK